MHMSHSFRFWPNALFETKLSTVMITPIKGVRALIDQFLGLLSPARPADTYRKFHTLGLTCKQALIISAWVRIFLFSRESMRPFSSNASRR